MAANRVREGQPLFLGVDGGGSKTLAIVVDAQGHERGRGQAGSGNHVVAGVRRASAHIHEAARAAATAAGATLPVARAWIGLSGVDIPADHALLYPSLKDVAGVTRLTNDAELVLSGLHQGIGVAVVAGTGSIALGRGPDGASARAGGWGHVLGDEGSGYEIGRAALVAAMRAADGRGTPSLLTSHITQRWGASTPAELMERVYHGNGKVDIAALAQVVFLAAREGDPSARGIVRRASAELALAAEAVANKLAFGAAPIPLALGGSLLVREAGFRSQVVRRLRRRRRLGQIAIVAEPALAAACAARFLAADAAGTVDPCRAAMNEARGSTDKER